MTTTLEEQVLKRLQREKIRMQETLRSDLAGNSPEWHREELRKTEQAIATGAAYFVDWEDAKEELKRDEVEDIKHGDQGFI